MDSINNKTLTHSKINSHKIYISTAQKIKNTHKKVQWPWTMNNKMKIDLKMIVFHEIYYLIFITIIIINIKYIDFYG